MANVNRDIKYINRDFSSFRQRLIEFSKTYFPLTYNDFTPASPGMMFIEQASYVGDVLSFYLDNQFQETFVQYAQQTNNVFELRNVYFVKKLYVSEVGFETTPGEPDCDLNAAP